MIVVDASVVISALVDAGPTGMWAEDVPRSGDLVAPHLMPVASANILRRAALRGNISRDTAALSYAGLLGQRVDHYPWEAVAERAWELRASVTMYDARYVALAELLDADVATLDERLARAPGPACGFRTPPGNG